LVLITFADTLLNIKNEFAYQKTEDPTCGSPVFYVSLQKEPPIVWQTAVSG